MTLAELGRILGKSRQYMSELERGNIRLTYDMALKIARAFGTTPDEIFLPTGSNDAGLDDAQAAALDPTGTEGGVR
ncbi:MAG TPA: helix-turn-helix transcriptional regulator [Clostridia bacterium]|nr:helix-turn-helix transcriptional regulator [Clostridia bacterium]